MNLVEQLFLARGRGHHAAGTGDALDRTWDQVIHFHPDGAPASHDHAPVPIEPRPIELNLDESRLIRDERGVRLAREVESSD